MILIMDTTARFFKRYDCLEEIYDHLKGMQVDILVYTPIEFKQMRDRPFIKQALKEGKVIYEQ